MLMAVSTLMSSPFQLLGPPDFFSEQGHLDDVELVVQLFNLIQVFLLHLPPRVALLAFVGFFREQQLVDHDAMGINLIARQLLYHSFSLVEREELGDADADESRHVGVLELAVDFGNGLSEGLKLLREVVQAGSARKPSSCPNY